MKGTAILVAFFMIFLFASLLIPSPMFPGSALVGVLGKTVEDYALVLSALLNGLFYGGVLWSVFAVISRRLEKE